MPLTRKNARGQGQPGWKQLKCCARADMPELATAGSPVRKMLDFEEARDRGKQLYRSTSNRLSSPYVDVW